MMEGLFASGVIFIVALLAKAGASARWNPDVSASLGAGYGAMALGQSTIGGTQQFGQPVQGETGLSPAMERHCAKWSNEGGCRRHQAQRPSTTSVAFTRPLSEQAHRGGARHAGTGRGSPGKTPFVAAVQCTSEGHPVAMRMDIEAGLRKAVLSAWAQRYLAPGSAVVSDGLNCFPGVIAAHCTQEAIPTGGVVPCANPTFFVWVNTLLGNVKNALRGTFQAVRLQRYRSEFCYRFNRRFELDALIPRFLYAAARTPPLRYELATLAA